MRSSLVRNASPTRNFVRALIDAARAARAGRTRALSLTRRVGLLPFGGYTASVWRAQGPHRMLRWLEATGLRLALLLLFATRATGGVDPGRAALAIDFRKPEQAVLQAEWSDPGTLLPDATGLGWESPAGGGAEDWVRTAELLPLGSTWSAPVSAVVSVRTTWTGSDASARTGRVFVRYGIDGEAWSTWQPLPEDESRAMGGTRLYTASLRVPRTVRRAYERGLHEFAESGPPAPTDEEAAVDWLRARDREWPYSDPPFLGYVQVLYELRMAPQTRLTELVVTADWESESGGAGAPTGRQGPWRYRADGRHRTEQGALLDERRAVYAVVLRRYGATVVVSDPVGPGSVRLPESEERSWSDIFRRLPGTQASARADFVLSNKQPQALPPHLDTGGRIVRWPEERARLFQAKHRNQHWKALGRLFPDAVGIVYLSGIGFSEDRTQAVVHVGHMFGFLAGGGTLYLLEQREGKWVVAASTRTWVS